jgi:hypothetical protein
MYSSIRIHDYEKALRKTLPAKYTREPGSKQSHPTGDGQTIVRAQTFLKNYPMNQFKDMGIAPTIKSFQGEKIKIERVLNCEIQVCDYKIEDSKLDNKKGNGKCLYLQIKFGNEYRIIFTGSAVLMNMVERVDKLKFPFTTTIVKRNDHFEFT